MRLPQIVQNVSDWGRAFLPFEDVGAGATPSVGGRMKERDDAQQWAEATEVAEIKEEWRRWSLQQHGAGWVARHFEAEWGRTKHMRL